MLISYRRLNRCSYRFPLLIFILIFYSLIKILFEFQSKPSYVFVAELHENVPEEMRRFIHKSSKSYSVNDLLNLTQWSTTANVIRNDRISKRINNKIHLIVQWYSENNRRRRLELISVLHVNVLNPAISKIHFIQNTMNCTIFEDLKNHSSFPLDLFRSKLILTYHFDSVFSHKRLSISQVFQYANRMIPDGYIILGNLDVIFDQSFLLLKSQKLFPRQMIFYLSRYEIDPSITTLGPQCSDKHYVGSHDALIFQSSIPSTIIDELPFEIGTWNIEVKIISVFMHHQYQVKNPCKSLRIWHYHSSQIRHRTMPSKKYVPDRLLSLVMRPPEFL